MLTGLALVVLVTSAWVAGRFGRPGAVALAVCSVVWLVADRRMEGPVLWQVSSSHGVVAADLAGFAGLLLAALQWLRPSRK